MPSLSVAALLLPPSIRYKALDIVGPRFIDGSESQMPGSLGKLNHEGSKGSSEHRIAKVKAVLRRRGTSAKQLFALQALKFLKCAR